MMVKPPSRRLQGLVSQLLAPERCAAASLGAKEAAAVPSGPTAEEEEEKEHAAFRRYLEQGKARFLALDRNRGPVRLDADGNLAKEILDAYWEQGFYVFEGVFSEEELQEVRVEVDAVMENAPRPRGSKLDKHGRPVKRPWVYEMWAKPLSDPLGLGPFGQPNYTDGKVVSRHLLKMWEPTPGPAAGIPADEVVPHEIAHPFGHMDAALRAYAHPQVLKVVEAVNGPDWTAGGGRVYVKRPLAGTSTAWHQDPSAAWDEAWARPGFDLGITGANFHISLYHCTPENALWILPRSPQMGRIDQKALSVRSGGGDRLLGGVPILCKPGDFFVQNRLTLHGAFPNLGLEPRVTLQWNTFPHATVLGKRRPDGKGVMDEAYLQERMGMIQLAIDARRQKHPEETPYVYAPFRGKEDECRWNEMLKEDSFSGYSQNALIL